MFEPAKLVRLSVMARALGVRVPDLRAEALAGRLPHVRLGQSLLFSPTSVETILAERAAQPPRAISKRPTPIAGRAGRK